MTGGPWENVGRLEIAAGVIVVLVLALATEIFFSLCRLHDWIYRTVTGKKSRRLSTEIRSSLEEGGAQAAPQRRASVPHVWSEVTVNSSSTPHRIHTPQDELHSELSWHSRQDISSSQSFRSTWNSESYSSSSDQSSQRLYSQEAGLKDSSYYAGKASSADSEDDLDEHTYRALCERHLYKEEDWKYRYGTITELLRQKRIKRRLSAQHERRQVRTERITRKHRSYQEQLTHQQQLQKSVDQQLFGSAEHSLTKHTLSSSQRAEEERQRAEKRRLALLLLSGHFHIAQTSELLIFSGEYTKAMDQDWHSGHFCCWNCEKSLTGHRYILRDEHPFCIACYESLFANNCEECKAPIGTDSKDLSYKEKHWHEHCFKCCDCQNSLVDQPFASKNEKLYCADCHDNNFAARCDGCGNIFRAGMKKFEFRGKQWHEPCFCCSVCKQAIGNKRFIPRDQEFVCVPCYEDQFAQRCAKCNGVINKGGITYKSVPFHRDCFTCTNCNKILAGEKFTSRDEQPYCADCFGELFAKKCCRCTRPITGLGGTKFISFDDRHWHSDCFGCYRCSNSLVGRGFLTNVDEILCPECGKNM